MARPGLPDAKARPKLGMIVMHYVKPCLTGR
jgi:hypothetical protein